MCNFSVDYRAFDNSNIIDIYTYLIKKRKKVIFRFSKKIFIGSIISIVIASSHTKCVSLSNQKCMIQPTLNNLHPAEYS